MRTESATHSTPDPNRDNAPLDPDAQAVVDEFNALSGFFSSGHATPHGWGRDNSGIQSGQNSTSYDDDDDDDGAKNYRLSPWMQARVDAEEAFMEAKGRGMTPRQGGAINPGSGDEGSTTLLGGTDLTAADDDLSNGDPAGPDDDRGGIAD